MNLHSRARSCPASRALLVERIREERWSVARAAHAAGVSQTTAYKWLRRFREEGEAGLCDRSSRPSRSPRRTRERLERAVVDFRRSRMTMAQIAQRLRLARSTVARISRRHGLSRLKSLEPPVPVVRFERQRPGELIHLDVKKLGRIKGIGHRITGDRRSTTRGIGWEYVHVCIDDASRLSYVEVLDDEKGTTVAGFLERAVAWYAAQGITVEAVMTDNGSGYVSRWFAAACGKLRLRHLRTRPYTPRTNGKAERFIQTLLREWAYARPYISSKRRTAALIPWLRYYNLRRPHAAIGGPPITRLRRAA